MNTGDVKTADCRVLTKGNVFLKSLCNVSEIIYQLLRFGSQYHRYLD